MKKVYLVTAGCYSDYHVCAVFSTIEKADEFMNTVRDREYNDVEEMEVDPQTVDLVRRGYSLWYVWMLRSGEVESICRVDIDTYRFETKHTIWERSKAPAFVGKGKQDLLQSYVWAKTEEAAIKIVNEHRTMLIASGRW